MGVTPMETRGPLRFTGCQAPGRDGSYPGVRRIPSHRPGQVFGAAVGVIAKSRELVRKARSHRRIRRRDRERNQGRLSYNQRACAAQGSQCSGDHRGSLYLADSQSSSGDNCYASTRRTPSCGRGQILAAAVAVLANRGELLGLAGCDCGTVRRNLDGLKNGLCSDVVTVATAAFEQRKHDHWKQEQQPFHCDLPATRRTGFCDVSPVTLSEGGSQRKTGETTGDHSEQNRTSTATFGRRL